MQQVAPMMSAADGERWRPSVGNRREVRGCILRTSMAASETGVMLSRADWLSLGQLVFTILGFGLAIWQLARAATAVEASQDLLKTLRVRLLGNDLLVMLPELHVLEDALDAALKGGDRLVIEKALVTYARTAGQIAGFLESEESTAEEAIIPLLKKCVSLATKAKADLAEGVPTDLRDTTRAAVARIAKVSAEVSPLVARLQRKAE